MIRKQKDSLRHSPQAVFFIQKWAMRKKEPVKKKRQYLFTHFINRYTVL